jgi:WD40 repeat protein
VGGQALPAYKSLPLARNPECRYVASSSKDGSVRVWDTTAGRCERILTGHTQSVTCLRWGGDGLLYSASQDRTIKVWRAHDVRMRRMQNPVWQISGHKMLVLGVNLISASPVFLNVCWEPGAMSLVCIVVCV